MQKMNLTYNGHSRTRNSMLKINFNLKNFRGFQKVFLSGVRVHNLMRIFFWNVPCSKSSLV